MRSVKPFSTAVAFGGQNLYKKHEICPHNETAALKKSTPRTDHTPTVQFKADIFPIVYDLQYYG